ncbi:MAG: hypothetical protein CM1200mP24_06060 [Gammaproteobacteria bacterium]|nr:MAG: hypothetical protein CM1200mP24_06060 [Gammaproteobacteria bacterium]
MCHTMLMTEQIINLDVKGLNCPMPLLKAKKALNEMEVGRNFGLLQLTLVRLRIFRSFRNKAVINCLKPQKITVRIHTFCKRKLK